MHFLTGLILVAAVVLAPDPLSEQPVGPVDPRLELQSNFWSNLHQFLYLLAQDESGMVPDRPTVEAARRDAESVDLSDEERRAWAGAIAFYGEHIAERRPWGSLAPVQAALRTADEAPAELSIPGLAEVLATAAPIYRARWWAVHDSVNRAWIKEVEALRVEHGSAVAEFLSRALATPWPAGSFPVEVAAHVTMYGAFQQDEPLQLNISSTYAGHRGSTGLEQLYHEAGHVLDDRVYEALRDELSRQGRTVRRGTARDLAHKILFYTVGEAVRRHIPGHVPYAEAWGVWRRDPESLALLRTHWQAWLDGTIGFDEAISHLVAGLRGGP